MFSIQSKVLALNLQLNDIIDECYIDKLSEKATI